MGANPYICGRGLCAFGMKAALLYGPGQALRVEDVSTPKPLAGEVLVKVRACGICGTDLHVIDGNIKQGRIPMVPGEEICGDVVEVGSGVSRVERGDRVLVNAVVSCGRCYYCTTGIRKLCVDKVDYGTSCDGGYAEYVAVRDESLHRLPDDISYEEGALLTDALLVPFDSMKMLKVEAGDTVAIYGVGGLGMCAVQVAALRGASPIAVDLFDDKLELAKRFGARAVVNARESDPVEKIREFTGGRGADVAFDVAGGKTTLQQAIRSVRKGGRIGIIGGSNDTFSEVIRYILWNNLTIMGCIVDLESNLPSMIQVVREGRINLKGMVTHRVRLEDINEGLRIMREKTGNPIRIMVKPEGHLYPE